MDALHMATPPGGAGGLVLPVTDARSMLGVRIHETTARFHLESSFLVFGEGVQVADPCLPAALP